MVSWSVDLEVLDAVRRKASQTSGMRRFTPPWSHVIGVQGSTTLSGSTRQVMSSVASWRMAHHGAEADTTL